MSRQGNRYTYTQRVEPMDEILEQVRAIPDPVERAKAAGGMMGPVQAELVKIRREALRELKEQGWSYNDIATALGLHRNRVQQIVEGRSR